MAKISVKMGICLVYFILEPNLKPVYSYNKSFKTKNYLIFGIIFTNILLLYQKYSLKKVIIIKMDDFFKNYRLPYNRSQITELVIEK